MNEPAFQNIKNLFNAKHIAYNVVTHPECRTSEESAKVRSDAGFPDAIGAKALLCKASFRTTGDEFVVFVLPGIHVLDKAKLKLELPDLKQFRFATPEELLELAGVVPGCMPPFGKQIFDRIKRMYISSNIRNFERVAFNAAKLDTSIILKTEDYFNAIEPDGEFDFSKPKDLVK
jgi:Ala-tRNA(Pro) deacylase